MLFLCGNIPLARKSSLSEINNHFKLPIHYVAKKIELPSNIIIDLELTRLNPATNALKTIYQLIFSPTSIVGETVLDQFTQFYTTDSKFIKETQQLLKNYTAMELKPTSYCIAEWDEIKYDTGFNEKYQFIEWTTFEYLNHSKEFLQVLCIYNIFSPFLSLLIPIFIFIVPFLILKMKGAKVTWEMYFEILKDFAANHAIGKMFNSKCANTQEIAYFSLSFAIYVFSIYQNLLICIQFHENMKKIHAYFKILSTYLGETIEQMEKFSTAISLLKSYKKFNKILITHCSLLKEMYFLIHPYTYTSTLFSFSSMFQWGEIMHTFYQFHKREEYHETMLYSFGFHGFLENLHGLHAKLQSRQMNFGKISKKKKTVMKKCYYPSILENPVKNDITLADVSQNIIITGPNASGKTTLIKSCFINIILSQTWGCGYYSSCHFNPFDELHCYLNIPDTSGRDSLFQAECRRCKQIIDAIDKTPEKRHFCMFDELYSGTNPFESSKSVAGFMDYIIKKPNVTCMLTTHFTDVCSILEKTKKITNYQMNTIVSNDMDFTYTYRLVKGISQVQGGKKILRDMNYPIEILDYI